MPLYWSGCSHPGLSFPISVLASPDAFASKRSGELMSVITTEYRYLSSKHTIPACVGGSACKISSHETSGFGILHRIHEKLRRLESKNWSQTKLLSRFSSTYRTGRTTWKSAKKKKDLSHVRIRSHHRRIHRLDAKHALGCRSIR